MKKLALGICVIMMLTGCSTGDKKLAETALPSVTAVEQPTPTPTATMTAAQKEYVEKENASAKTFANTIKDEDLKKWFLAVVGEGLDGHMTKTAQKFYEIALKNQGVPGVRKTTDNSSAYMWALMKDATGKDMQVPVYAMDEAVVNATNEYKIASNAMMYVVATQGKADNFKNAFIAAMKKEGVETSVSDVFVNAYQGAAEKLNGIETSLSLKRTKVFYTENGFAYAQRFYVAKKSGKSVILAVECNNKELSDFSVLAENVDEKDVDKVLVGIIGGSSIYEK